VKSGGQKVRVSASSHRIFESMEATRGRLVRGSGDFGNRSGGALPWQAEQDWDAALKNIVPGFNDGKREEVGGAEKMRASEKAIGWDPTPPTWVLLLTRIIRRRGGNSSPQEFYG